MWLGIQQKTNDAVANDNKYNWNLQRYTANMCQLVHHIQCKHQQTAWTKDAKQYLIHSKTAKHKAAVAITTTLLLQAFVKPDKIAMLTSSQLA